MHLFSRFCVLLCFYTIGAVCSIAATCDVLERICNGKEDIVDIITNDKATFRSVIRSASVHQFYGVTPLIIEASVSQKGDTNFKFDEDDMARMIKSVLGSRSSIEFFRCYATKHNCTEQVTRFIFQKNLLIPVPESYEIFTDLLRALFFESPGFVQFETPKVCKTYGSYDEFATIMRSHFVYLCSREGHAEEKTRIVHDCLAYEALTDHPSHMYAEGCIDYTNFENTSLTAMLMLSKQLEQLLISPERNDCTTIWSMLNEDFVHFLSNAGRINELYSMLSAGVDSYEIIKYIQSLKIELYLKHYQLLKNDKLSRYRGDMISSPYFEHYFENIWNVAKMMDYTDEFLPSLFSFYEYNNHRMFTLSSCYPLVSKLDSGQLSKYFGREPPDVCTLQAARPWFYRSWYCNDSNLLKYLSPACLPYNRDAFSEIRPLAENTSFIHMLTQDCIKKIFLLASKIDADFLSIYLKFPLVCKAWNSAASSVQLSDILNSSQMALSLYLHDSCESSSIQIHNMWPWGFHKSPCDISTLSLDNFSNSLVSTLTGSGGRKILMKLKPKTPDSFIQCCRVIFGKVIYIDFPKYFTDQQNADILLKLFADTACVMNFEFCKRRLYVVDKLYFGIINKIVGFTEKEKLLSSICGGHLNEHFHPRLVFSHHLEQYSCDTINYFFENCSFFQKTPYSQSKHSSLDNYFMDLFCLDSGRLFYSSCLSDIPWFFKMMLKAFADGRSAKSLIGTQSNLLQLAKRSCKSKYDLKTLNNILKFLKNEPLNHIDPDKFHGEIICWLAFRGQMLKT